MHDVGVIHLAANLVCEACGEVDVLVAGVDVEAAGVLCLCASDDCRVVFRHGAVTVGVLEFRHAGECCLALRDVVV